MVTEEAVPGGGQSTSHGQRESKWGSLAREEETSGDTVFAIGKEQRRGQTAEFV